MRHFDIEDSLSIFKQSLRRRKRGGGAGGDAAPLEFFLIAIFGQPPPHVIFGQALDKIFSQKTSVPPPRPQTKLVPYISVARGGGGGRGGNCPPPPNNVFSDFCRYIWKFVGTLRNLSVHVSRQACHLYRQSI